MHDQARLEQAIERNGRINIIFGQYVLYGGQKMQHLNHPRRPAPVRWRAEY
jgi:hypothetical protein